MEKRFNLQNKKQKVEEIFYLNEKRLEIITNGDLCIETKTSKEITNDDILEISNFFRLTFNNEFPEFLVEPNFGEFFGAREFFGINDKKIQVPLEISDFLSKDELIEQNTGKEFYRIHDERGTIEAISKKLYNEGFLTIMKKGNIIVGLMFGYSDSIKKIFQNEWGEIYGYGGKNLKGFTRSFDNFLEKTNNYILNMKDGLNQNRILDENSKQFCWNCVITDPNFRGIKNFLNLSSNFFSSIPNEIIENMYTFGESIKGSTSNGLFKIAGATEIEGILKDDYVITMGPLKKAKENFSLSMKDFIKLQKKLKNK